MVTRAMNLDQVAGDERITIAKHGAPVAVLQPVDTARQTPVRTVIDQMRSFRRGRRLAGLSPRELLEEGRD
jgi:antitoxin (DNA-binding transcriptional repressor) of toxin-antitoxin stability system